VANHQHIQHWNVDGEHGTNSFHRDIQPAACVLWLVIVNREQLGSRMASRMSVRMVSMKMSMQMRMMSMRMSMMSMRRMAG